MKTKIKKPVLPKPPPKPSQKPINDIVVYLINLSFCSSKISNHILILL